MNILQFSGVLPRQLTLSRSAGAACEDGSGGQDRHHVPCYTVPGVQDRQTSGHWSSHLGLSRWYLQETHARRIRETAAKVKQREKGRRIRWAARRQMKEQLDARARRQEKKRLAQEARAAIASSKQGSLSQQA